ncbi:hypothetical protein BLJAPNOD_06304 [Ensifer sp. M14]|nr:hypothetical protein BLJAPNOD_06304 [Ensifer sp. M14]
MKSLCLAALAEWRRVFGDNLFILQWTLAMQAIQCRMEKRYLNANGVLAHPSWNIVEMTLLANDVQGMWRFADADAVKFKSLFVDRDLHPSALGYLYLTEVYRTRNHEEAFWAAFRSYRVAFDRIFNAFGTIERRRRILTGDSFAIKVMDRMIPLEFRRRFEELGLRMVFSPDTALDIAKDCEPFDELVYVSQAKLGSVPNDAATQWSKTREKFKDAAQKVTILPWEAIFEQLSVRRGGYASGVRVPLALDVFDTLRGAADLDYIDLLECGGANDLVEHGAGGAPTLDGVFFILSVAAGGKELLVRPFGS